MKFELKENSGVVDILLPLCNLFPNKSLELMNLCLKSKRGVQVEIKTIGKSRTPMQERYYRKWCGEFAKSVGMTHDEMHEEILCRAFGSEHITTSFGEIRRPIKRSSEVGVTEYSSLIEMLIFTASELNFYIPPAEKQ
tara:strand:- start:938 stop:1351 length:414 start_codon:yes stop_codon:yes gene_type:complete